MLRSVFMTELQPHCDLLKVQSLPKGPVTRAGDYSGDQTQCLRHVLQNLCLLCDKHEYMDGQLSSF